jgi:phytoene dehydrogenase-like protein
MQAMRRSVGGDVDAVVVGAGHNGLVAANLLADAGWQVVVCEATEYAGGAVRTAEIAAPGYQSDVFSAFYPLSAASPVISSLRLQDYGLSWTHAPDVLAHVFPDDRCAVLSRDLNRTAASLDTFAAGDGAAWRRLAEGWAELEQPLLDALFTPLPALGPASRMLGRLGVGGSLRMARMALLPVRRLGEELFHGEGGTILLAGNALHADLPPEGAGSAVYGWLLAMLGQQVGWPVPVGGAQQITAALVARLLERGGRIEYEAPVSRILVARGRAMGARTADGRDWRARRAVLADIPAPALYLDMVGERWLPPRFVEDLAHFRWDGATLKVDWAVSAPMPWKNPAAAGAGTIHLGADLNGLSRYAAHLATDELPPDPFLLLGQMSTADPSHSPAGTESLWAYTHLPHRQSWTAEEMSLQVERMEAVIEAHAPGFSRLVVGRNVFSPADLQREDPSLVGGALGGGTAAAFQQLFLRPIPGLGRADTPVDRLFLASSSAHPGGGVHGAPGANAARAALARDRALTGALYRSVIDVANRAIYR